MVAASPAEAETPAYASDGQEKSKKPKKKSRKKTKDAGDEKDENEDENRGKTVVAGVPFAKLVELNSAALFGGKVKLDGETIEISYDTDGQMAAGFQGRKIIDSKHPQMQGAQRNFIVQEKKDDKEILIPGLTACGMGRDAWVSRFPLAGDARVQFGFRVPNLITQQSTFRVRLNFNKKKGTGFETGFFQNLAYLSRGRVKSNKMTPIKKYQRAASYWFPRKKSSTQIDFGIRDGNCAVKMNGEQMVNVEDISDQGGHVAFVYDKILFTIDNLKITGKLDRDWVEKEIARLKRRGELVVEKPLESLPE